MVATKVVNAGRRYQEFFGAIYEYREYLFQSVSRDLRVKYKRSSLGYLWSMLNPLFMMIILTIVFSNIMSRVESYSVFLFCGLLPWQYFSQTALGSMDAIRQNIKIIEHVPIPKFIFSLSIAFSNMFNFFLCLIPLFLVMLVVGRPIHWTVLCFPMILLPLFFTSMGVALLFSVANIFFDDTRHLSGVIMSGLYYLCPILYGRQHLPDELVSWLVLNPMFLICENMRELFYFGRLPDLETYTYNLLGSLLLLAFSLWVFKKTEDKFIYFT